MGLAAAVYGLGSIAGAGTAPKCEPGGGTVELSGTVGSEDAKTFLVLPVDIAEGTTRIEVGYGWEPPD